MPLIEYIDYNYKPGKDELVAEYFVEADGISLEKACEHIAGESSIGTWTTISTMNPRIAKKLKPHVYYIKKSGKNSGYVKIAYKAELFEAGSIPQIWSSIAGNIFGMKVVKNLRLEDISFPKSIARAFKGPRYGIEGIRKIVRFSNRPLTGTIVKPKVGLNPKQHAEVAYNAWAGGLDVVKDDENLTSMKFNKFKDRIIQTLKMRDLAEKQTGEKKIYMPNITAETDEMIRRANFVKMYGGEYVMVDILTCGWSGLQTVRESVDQVIHAHRAMHGALTKNPKHGISMMTIAKCARLAGVDQLHVGTASVGKMEGEPLEVEEIEDEIEEKFFVKEKDKRHILEQDWHGIKSVLAVASGGLHPGSIPLLLERMGKNIVMQFGGGCHGHPMGTKAGAVAIRQALQASL
ncbi:type III ribulose-bisphosphate carboxylase, partial [Candidatus Woesearchaeota archaeon]|nr:type III ribulose-bisphosphate carboxylase [Candidatus Woesearchaeota archaeon]